MSGLAISVALFSQRYHFISALQALTWPTGDAFMRVLTCECSDSGPAVINDKFTTQSPTACGADATVLRFQYDVDIVVVTVVAVVVAFRSACDLGL